MYQWMLVIAVILLIIAITQYHQLKKAYDSLKESTNNYQPPNIDAHTALKQAEYLALQNQINPHFLYNTLEAIRGDALCEGADEIANTTRALATFFRYTVTEVGYLVTLEDEINNIKNYFIIQQYRFGERLNLEIHLPTEELQLLQAQVPKLTLQPIVENAVSHGLEVQKGNGTVKISITWTKNNLLISIKDNGIGIDEKTLLCLNKKFQDPAIPVSKGKKSREGGIALANVNSRIKLLFGADYGLHMYSVKGIGTDVKIIIPLKIETLNRNKDG